MISASAVERAKHQTHELRDHWLLREVEIGALHGIGIQSSLDATELAFNGQKTRIERLDLCAEVIVDFGEIIFCRHAILDDIDDVQNMLSVAVHFCIVAQ